VLRLWVTDYKTFRGTNWRPQPGLALLQDHGLQHWGSPEAYLSQKLGTLASRN
jgi:hypothetical protein